MRRIETDGMLSAVPLAPPHAFDRAEAAKVTKSRRQIMGILGVPYVAGVPCAGRGSERPISPLFPVHGLTKRHGRRVSLLRQSSRMHFDRQLSGSVLSCVRPLRSGRVPVATFDPLCGGRPPSRRFGRRRPLGQGSPNHRSGRLLGASATNLRRPLEPGQHGRLGIDVSADRGPRARCS